MIALARGACQRAEDQIVCVTLGRRGVIALVDGDVIAIPGHAVTAPSIRPGPAIASSVRWRRGSPMARRSARRWEYANLAASICVQRMGAGASMPATHDEVMAGLNGGTTCELTGAHSAH